MKMTRKLLLSTGLLMAAAASHAGSGMYEVEVSGLQGLNILEGSTVWQPEPLYPSLALRRGLEGEVLVEYSINASGKAENIRILDAAPRGFFNNATIGALESATFAPTYEEGQAVAVAGIKKRFIYRIEREADGESRSVVLVD